jgi:hypothetical protein
MRQGLIIGVLLVAALLWAGLRGGPESSDTAEPPLGGELRFQLTGIEGRALRGAILRLQGPGLVCRFFRPDAAGRIAVVDTLRHAGLYRLRASAPGFRPLCLELRGGDLRARSARRLCPIVLLAPLETGRRGALDDLRVKAPQGALRWRWQPSTPSALTEGRRSGEAWPEDLPGAGDLEVWVVRRQDSREEIFRLALDLRHAQGAWRRIPGLRLATGLKEGSRVAISHGGEPGPFLIGLRHLRVGPQGVIEVADLRRRRDAVTEVRWAENGKPRCRLLQG